MILPLAVTIKAAATGNAKNMKKRYIFIILSDLHSSKFNPLLKTNILYYVHHQSASQSLCNSDVITPFFILHTIH